MNLFRFNSHKSMWQTPLNIDSCLFINIISSLNPSNSIFSTLCDQNNKYHHTNLSTIVSFSCEFSMTYQQHLDEQGMKINKKMFIKFSISIDGCDAGREIREGNFLLLHWHRHRRTCLNMYAMWHENGCNKMWKLTILRIIGWKLN